MRSFLLGPSLRPIVLTGCCYFRGNYMIPNGATGLLDRLCSVRELIPEFWNIVEPIDVPFRADRLQEVVSAIAPPSSVGRARSLTFFARKAHPSCLVSFDLRLAPVQWTTAHNSIELTIFDEWNKGDSVLAQYLSESVRPGYPDFASIPTWTSDSERYSEFRRPYTPEQFKNLFGRNRPIVAPFGPYGVLGDVQWFNYFGRVYVEAIGKARLVNAGWHQVEEFGDGLACYATPNINDRHSRERRSRIAQAIAEFVWTPGCKPEEKSVPDFDFSEQHAVLPADVSTGAVNVITVGISKAKQKEVKRLLGSGEAETGSDAAKGNPEAQ